MLKVLKMFVDYNRNHRDISADMIQTNLPDSIDDIVVEQIYKIWIPNTEEEWKVYVIEAVHKQEDLRNPLRVCVMSEDGYTFVLAKKGVKIESTYTLEGRLLSIHRVASGLKMSDLIKVLSVFGIKLDGLTLMKDDKAIGEITKITNHESDAWRLDSGWLMFSQDNKIEFAIQKQFATCATLSIYYIDAYDKWPETVLSTVTHVCFIPVHEIWLSEIEHKNTDVK